MKASTSTPLSLKLYMKAGCHLCEAAEADLARLQRRYPHTLERIDIAAESSSDLLQRYGEQIPVVALNGREYAAPLSRTLLERALAEATMQLDQPPAGHDRGAAAHHYRRRGYDQSQPAHDPSQGGDDHSQPAHEQSRPAHDQSPPAHHPSHPTYDQPQPADVQRPPCDAAPAPHRDSPPVRPVTDTSSPPSALAMRSAFRHWLAALNAALAVFLLGGLAAPLLAALGWGSVADGLYAAYHFTCHQWAFRSFFLFTPGQPLVAVYSQQHLTDLGLDPFGLVGTSALGWKMAFCERDLAIYLALLVAGLYYARHRDHRPASFLIYGVLILPMALDGFTQLFGWRESTWQLRVVTGLLFGLASGWLVLPRLDVAFGLRPATGRYAPEPACEARQVAEPRPQLSPRG